jgi:hypothetical protein
MKNDNNVMYDGQNEQMDGWWEHKGMHVSSSDAMATDWENVERGHDRYKIKYVQMERRRTETGDGTENGKLAAVTNSKQGAPMAEGRGRAEMGAETRRKEGGKKEKRESMLTQLTLTLTLTLV